MEGQTDGGAVRPRWERQASGGPLSPTLEENFYPFVLRRQDTYTTEVPEEEEEEEEDDGARWGSKAERPQVLRQRERDLQLAAELGKALLERNEELAREKEEAIRECAQRVELIEQERHQQRRRFEARQSEWEARVSELEDELAHLGGQHERDMRETQRKSGRAAQALEERNLQLAEELSKAEIQEHSLLVKLQAVQNDLRVISLSNAERLDQIQSLRTEKQTLVDRNRAAEERIKTLQEEQEILQSGIESLESSLLLLQKHSDRLEIELQQVQTELSHANTTNLDLREHLHQIKEEMGLQDLSVVNTSLHSEIQNYIEGSPHRPSLTETGSLRSDSSSSDDFHRSGEELRSLREVGRQHEASLKERERQIQRLNEQVRLLRVELAAVREQLDSLRQITRAGDRDEVLELALSSRDRALSKKTEMELEVEKARIERELLSQQLLQTIKQKIGLAQELEEWQDDMQVVISQQLRSQHQRQGLGGKERTPPALQEGGVRTPAGRGFFFRFKKS